MKIYLFILMFCFTLLTACTTNLSSDHYTSDELCKAQKVNYGKIVKAKIVKVEEPGNAATGTLAGGYAGLVAGTTASDRPKESAIFGVVGALLGAVAGHEVGKNVGKQKAIQYIVHLDNGKTLAIVQGCDPLLTVGQRVMVLRKGHNRDRVLAA